MTDQKKSYPIRVSDDVYEALTRLKRSPDETYNAVVRRVCGLDKDPPTDTTLKETN